METTTDHSALLVMDVQSAILENLTDKEEFMLRINKAIDHARKNEIRVIFVRVGFRKNIPEVDRNNKIFGSYKEKILAMGEEAFLALEPSLNRNTNDIIVTKRRVSAFTGSDLDVVLRAQRINHLILAGIATSGVVLSTLREAADRDFAITVLEDACADNDSEVHNILMKKIFPRQASVKTLNEL